MADPTRGGSGTRTVITCMLANNFTLGLVYGSFGALLVGNEQALGVARGTISFGMSAISTTLGLSALVMGNLVRRLTPRWSIAIGVVATAIGFAGLSETSDFRLALALWALLGFGAALAAILGPVAIAAEHFPGKAGKVLGLINLPLVLFIAPWAVTEAMHVLGRHGTYLLFGALLFPVLALVLTLPVGNAEPGRHDPVPTRKGPIVSRADFWLISLGIGLIAGTGTAYVSHGIAYAESRGLSAPSAALIMSAYSGAGLLGVLVFGWLADRIGGARTLALSAVVQCLSWAGLALSPPAGFLLLSAVLGVATTPLTTLHGAAMAQLFGPDGVSRAMGYSFAIKLPFLFATSPLVGFAYVRMGDYRPGYLMVAAGLVGAAMLLMAGHFAQNREHGRPVPA